MSPKLSTPSQKNYMVFARPWRLMGRISSSSDCDLEHSSEACESLEFFCGGLVVFGLLVELAIAVAHPSYDSFWDRFGSVIADFFVAGGVIGEVFFSSRGSKFQGELTRRSNDRLESALNSAARAEAISADAQTKLAEANDRLAKTELELWRSQQPRFIDPAIFAQSIAGAPKAKVEVLYITECTDCMALAGWLVAALSSSGWLVTAFSPAKPVIAVPSNIGAMLSLAVAAGGQPWGISIRTHKETPISENTAGNRLYAALQASLIGDKAIAVGWHKDLVVAFDTIRVIVAPRA